jgi:hypothetical protein
MTEADLKRIEKELGLALPAVYSRIMLKFPENLRDWPPDGKVDQSQWFFTDVERILDVNKRIRKKPGEFVKSPKKYAAQWPANTTAQRTV